MKNLDIKPVESKIEKKKMLIYCFDDSAGMPTQQRHQIMMADELHTSSISKCFPPMFIQFTV
jgi:hypothetical protein